MDTLTPPVTMAPHPAGRRLLRALLWAVAALLLLLAALVAWASSEGSLSRALALAQRLLPQDQQLEYRDAGGSLIRGGHVGQLRWRGPGMTLAVDGLQLRWSLWQLRRGMLDVQLLHAREVHLRLLPAPPQPDAAPFTLPQPLSLPLRVRLPLAVDRLRIDGAEATETDGSVVIEHIAAGFAYDGVQHALRLRSLRHGQSTLQAQVQLDAADLALAGQVDATLRNLAAQVPLAMDVHLGLAGTLAGAGAARLDVLLDAAESSGATPARLHADAVVHPWRTQPLQRLELVASALDAHAFVEAAPVTAFGGTASLLPREGEAGAWDIRLDFANEAAGTWAQQRMPLSAVAAQARLTEAAFEVQPLQLAMADGGRVSLEGSVPLRQPGPSTLAVSLQQVDLQPWWQGLSRTSLSGTLSARGDLRDGLAFEADVANGAARGAQVWDVRALQARGNWSPARLAIGRLHAEGFGARVDGTGIEAALPALDAVGGRLTATAPGLALAASADGRAQAGGGSLSLEVASAQRVVAWLAQLPGVGPAVRDVTAQGSADLQLQWQGGWQQWLAAMTEPARHPGLGADARVQVRDLRLGLPAGAVAMDRLDATLQGNLVAADVALEGDVQAGGTQGRLDVHLRASQAAGGAEDPAWDLSVVRLAAAATLPGQEEPWQLEVAEGLHLAVRPGEALVLDAGAGHARLVPPRSVSRDAQALEIAWEPLQWQRGADGASRLHSRGTLAGLRPGWVDALLAPVGQAPLADAGLYTDLLLSGEWDVQVADRLDVHAQVRRDDGDLWMGQPNAARSGARIRREGIAAGIRTLLLSVQSEGDGLGLSLQWDSERAGVVGADVRTGLVRHGDGWRLPQDAPLSGSLRAQLQDVGVWGFLAPPGWRVQGALDADIRVSGTVDSPQLQGRLGGSRLNIRSVLDGVDLHEGTLQASLQGQRLTIDALTLQGGTGSSAHVRGLSGNRTPPPTQRGRMMARGSIDWSGVAGAAAGESGLAMDFTATLEKMQVLVRNDRQLSLSGDLSAGLHQGALKVRGDVAVDRAAIMLPEAGAPTLGDDVVVVRAGDADAAGSAPARGELQSAKPMDLEIRIDLGRDLALQGYGITTRLEGNLVVSSATGGNDPVRIVGTVRTAEGRFRAWGQALNVETGEVLFNGPYANPSLNLLAIRPEIAVRAGVRVTGTLDAPRVQLYSEPDMPESEKLSWVVLGRATVEGGAEGASMQQAALGLLAGGVGSSLAGGLGLDEIGLGESGISIGKRISDELYVTYEAGLSGAASTLYVFYDITRRFTVRGQTGKASAMDIIYTFTYD